MTKRENIDDPSSCWNCASDDEPIFILKATDEKSPALILEWAERYLVEKGGLSAVLTDKQRAKYIEAIRCAEAMQAWKEQHP